METKTYPTTRDAQTAPIAGLTDETVLREIREGITSLTHDVSAMVEKRYAQAARVVEDAAEPLQERIRSAPMMAIGIAVASGALLAILLTSSQDDHRDTWVDRSRRTLADLGNTSRRSLHDLGETDTVRQLGHLRDRAIDQARDTGSGLLSSVERLVGSISKMESGPAIQSAMDTASTFMKSMWGRR